MLRGHTREQVGLQYTIIKLSPFKSWICWTGQNRGTSWWYASQGWSYRYDIIIINAQLQVVSSLDHEEYSYRLYVIYVWNMTFVSLFCFMLYSGECTTSYVPHSLPRLAECLYQSISTQHPWHLGKILRLATPWIQGGRVEAFIGIIQSFWWHTLMPVKIDINRECQIAKISTFWV